MIFKEYSVQERSIDEMPSVVGEIVSSLRVLDSQIRDRYCLNEPAITYLETGEHEDGYCIMFSMLATSIAILITSDQESYDAKDCVLHVSFDSIHRRQVELSRFEYNLAQGMSGFMEHFKHELARWGISEESNWQRCLLEHQLECVLLMLIGQ